MIQRMEKTVTKNAHKEQSIFTVKNRLIVELSFRINRNFIKYFQFM